MDNQRSNRFIILVIIVFIAGAMFGARVMMINSWHSSYPPTAEMTEIIRERLDTLHNLNIYNMNLKLRQDRDYIERSAEIASRMIKQFDPDLLIIAEDNAAEYLVKKYLAESQTPTIHIGINWDTTLTYFNPVTSTGMVEINLIDKMMIELRRHADGDRVGFIGAHTLTNQIDAGHYGRNFKINFAKTSLVKSFMEWKTEFRAMQDSVDMIIVGEPAFLNSKTDKELFQKFMIEHTKVPTGSVEDWMKDFTLVCYAKQPSEFGEWAASKALAILNGTSPEDILVTINKKIIIFRNPEIAKQLRIDYPDDAFVPKTLH
jgi:hypothetical protein